MPKPHIVQALCGPARHCIMALPYEAGLQFRGQTVDESNAADLLRAQVDECIANKAIDPWCGICGRPREVWYFEDQPLRFNSLAEAIPYLAETLEANMQTQDFLRRSKN